MVELLAVSTTTQNGWAFSFILAKKYNKGAKKKKVDPVGFHTFSVEWCLHILFFRMTNLVNHD
jgi:hypothetical protein